MVAPILVSLQNRSFCKAISQQGINHLKMAFFAEKENEESEENHDEDGSFSHQIIHPVAPPTSIVNSVFNQYLLKNSLFCFFHTEQSDENAAWLNDFCVI